jgi:hypothetical protein
LDLVTDMAGAGACAQSGVGRLGSGQVRLGKGVDRAVLSAADGASAQPGAGHDVSVDIVGGIDRASDAAQSKQDRRLQARNRNKLKRWASSRQASP